MAQEWILSSWREQYDKWDGDDPITELPGARFRRWTAYLERYAKYTPPLTLNLVKVNAVLDPSEVECSAVNQTVNARGLITNDDIESGGAEAELLSRTLQFNTSESGVLMVMESWVMTYEDEIYDTEAGRWVLVAEYGI